MTVSLQLTSWALPSLLAVLVVVRELVYLWPRRRERAVPAFLTFAAASGLWALFHGLGVASLSPAAKVVLARMEYAPALVATLGLVWFSLLYVRREGELVRWPAWILYIVSLITAVLIFREGAMDSLIRGFDAVSRGEFVGVTLTAGVWHWVVLSTRVAVGGLAAWVLLESLRGSSEVLGARVLVVLAGLFVVSPAVIQIRSGPQPYWSNLSSVGFALAAGVLSLGLLRPRLLGVGPVARKLVMHALRDPIVVFDGKGRMVDVNSAAEEILGLRAFGDVPIALGTLWASSRGEAKDARSVLLPVRGRVDPPEERSFDVTVTPLHEDGAALRSALLLRDVTVRDRIQGELLSATEALEEANEELQRLANTDPLTALANRRHFKETLEREVERSARYSRPLSLLLLDLDHFKRVNDTHGHAAGDDVLRAAALVLRRACRDVDLAARLGGEELAILLPETGAEGAAIVAERVREEIQAGRHVSPEGKAFTVTASIGVASVQGADQSGEDLLQASDEALYMAKASGRNRVVVGP